MRVDAEFDGAVAEGGDAAEQQADEVHCVLPLDLALVAEVLFELLELGEDVGVVGSVDVATEEDMADFDQLLGEGRGGFDQWRIEAFEHVGVGL